MATQNTLALSIGSAIGGALLLFLGQIAVEEYKGHRQRVVEARAAVVAQEREKAQLLDDMLRQFDALGPASARAGEYVDSGRGGTKDDVNQVARHFRILIRYIAKDRINTASVASYYGGPVPYWSERFQKLSGGTSPAARHFSDTERASFKRLAEALDGLSQKINVAEEDAFRRVVNERRPGRLGRR